MRKEEGREDEGPSAGEGNGGRERKRRRGEQVRRLRGAIRQWRADRAEECTAQEKVMRGEGKGGRMKAEEKILTKEKDGQRRTEEGRRVHRKRC